MVHAENGDLIAQVRKHWFCPIRGEGVLWVYWYRGPSSQIVDFAGWFLVAEATANAWTLHWLFWEDGVCFRMGRLLEWGGHSEAPIRGQSLFYCMAEKPLQLNPLLENLLGQWEVGRSSEWVGVDPLSIGAGQVFTTWMMSNKIPLRWYFKSREGSFFTTYFPTGTQLPLNSGLAIGLSRTTCPFFPFSWILRNQNFSG